MAHTSVVGRDINNGLKIEKSAIQIITDRLHF
jgi:hypothetical protein